MEPRAVPSDRIRAHRRCVLQEAQPVQLIPAGRVVLRPRHPVGAFGPPNAVMLSTGLGRFWAHAGLVYDDKSRKLVLPFKHGDRTDVARACGAWMARAGADLLADADLVAPVPLHWRRLFTRRYNQAQLLARIAVAAAPSTRGRLVPDLMRRRRWTGSQTGLAAKQRHDNVRQAFDLNPRWAATVAGKSVLLIDDVLTTGATVEACVRVLQRGGARHVDVLTLARVVRPAV